MSNAVLLPIPNGINDHSSLLFWLRIDNIRLIISDESEGIIKIFFKKIINIDDQKFDHIVISVANNGIENFNECLQNIQKISVL